MADMKEKTFTIQHDVMEGENLTFSLTEQITHTMYEERDKFIFESISPYLYSLYKFKIPKKLLKRALVTFQNEHREEWDILMEEVNK